MRSPSSLSRRRLACAAATLFAVGPFRGLSATPASTRVSFDAVCASLEQRTASRIGVAGMNLATGAVVGFRGDERFAMCSTFKWLLAALVLQRVDRGEEDLNRPVAYREEDLVAYSPVTGPNVDTGRMSVGALCAAAVTTSDNAAANLLLATLGGPAGFTRMVRGTGDRVTRLDRWEPDLNENLPGDPRDTSSPLAIARLMSLLLFGPGLKDPSRRQLRQWMIEADTGLTRLRSGLPAGWLAGDKTGTADNRANHDVAFALPPTPATSGKAGGGPFIIVSFTEPMEPFSAAADATHAAIARAVVEGLT